MRIDENFIANFLQNIMKGIVSSREKQFLKDNPKIAKKVKDLKKSKDELTQLMKNYNGWYRQKITNCARKGVSKTS